MTAGTTAAGTTAAGNTIDANMPVGDVVTQYPSAARIFARHHIDFCCGGDQSLADACAKHDLPVHALIQAIRAAPIDAPMWTDMSLTAICDELERRYHRPLDDELPRLEALAKKVARVHGEKHPELHEVATTFAALHGELRRHMYKEEKVLFPMIRAHAQAPDGPIRVMRHEHDDAGAALRKMHALTHGYEPPADGCNSYRALMHGLAQLEHELHLHIHVENNVLFPRALA